MNEMRNLILAVVLSGIIVFGYQELYLKPKYGDLDTVAEQGPQTALGQQSGAEPGSITGEGAGAGGLGDTPQLNGPGMDGVSAAPGYVSGSAETTETAATPAPRLALETPELSGSISLRGARFDELYLNNHKVTLNGDAMVQFLRDSGRADGFWANFGWVGQGVDASLLPGDATLWTANGTTLTPSTPVTLSWDNGAGLVFEQDISVDDQFLFTVTQRVRNTGSEAYTLAPYGQLRRKGTPETDGIFILHEGPIAVLNGELREPDYDDLDSDPVSQSSAGGWMGFTDKYWMAILIPDTEASLPRVRMRRLSDARGLRHLVDFTEQPRALNPGTSVETTSRFFAGAKIVQVVDGYAETFGITLFDRTIDWGWLWFLTKPIFFGLELLFSWTGNFGVAIILFTFALKLALFPLANKQYVSMAHMKKVQPKMKALQERHKDDKQRLQQEMMELYRKEKINPLAGCLPLLPQVFVFFALYKVLYVTIDMRHQPFVGWITDLSAPDPLTPVNLFGLLPFDPPGFLAIGILPILMGVAMWGQQKLSPTQMDPAQQQIMNLLPIIFTFILAQFSAGLVLYWTLNSVLSIAQQWAIMRKEGAA